MTDHHNPPAFPSYAKVTAGEVSETRVADSGMTLRDYFAAQSLAGLLAGFYRNTTNANGYELPREAYLIADAMLAAREKTDD